MAETIPVETLQAMVERYERTLRRLVDEADDEARLYAHLTGPDSPVGATLLEIGRHQLYQEIRRFAVHTLHEFHPEIHVE